MLSFSDYRSHIDQMVAAAIKGADPKAAVSRVLHRGTRSPNAGLWLNDREIFRPDGTKRLILLSVGKAAVPMAQAAADVAGEMITAGLVVTKIGQYETCAHPRVTTTVAAHPVIDQTSIAAADNVLKLVTGLTPDDVVVFLLSGGASALVSRPLIPLAEFQDINRRLLASGRPIQDVNTVRQQLDDIKGGGLAAAAAPATIYTLILSDVIGNPVDKIGSGPTIPATGTAADAMAILQEIDAPIPAKLRHKVNAPPIPQPFSPPPLIIGDVRTAGEAARAKAEDLGFETEFLTWFLEGEASQVGQFAAALGRAAPSGRCLILGGETTVTIEGSGVGGRNLETALAAALGLEGVEGCAIASLATDGDDGPTGAAGAVITGQTIGAASQQGANAPHFLAENDSYTFFKTILPQNLIVTGQTGTNVNDLIFILKY